MVFCKYLTNTKPQAFSYNTSSIERSVDLSNLFLVAKKRNSLFLSFYNSTQCYQIYICLCQTLTTVIYNPNRAILTWTWTNWAEKLNIFFKLIQTINLTNLNNFSIINIRMDYVNVDVNRFKFAMNSNECNYTITTINR